MKMIQQTSTAKISAPVGFHANVGIKTLFTDDAAAYVSKREYEVRYEIAGRTFVETSHAIDYGTAVKNAKQKHSPTIVVVSPK